MKSQEQEFLPIVNDLVASQYVDEAIKILNAASPARVNEFMNYYKRKNHNVACMHLDTIKKELVFYGILKQEDSDEFGKYEF
jgi:hypothetical protein